MRRGSPLASVALAVIAFFAQPAEAVTPDDLDLSGFPEGSRVVNIAQSADGKPLVLCARPVRQRWIELAGPPKIKWVKVPLKPEARHDGHAEMEGVDFVWVQIEIPGTPGSEWFVDGIACIRKCPEGAKGKRCVVNPETPCPVCQE